MRKRERESSSDKTGICAEKERVATGGRAEEGERERASLGLG